MHSLQMEGPVGARTVFNGRTYDYFSGTGYLGLQSHPQVLQAAADCLARYGLSTATSRGGLGEHPVYLALDEAACAYFDAQKVLTLASGYLGMLALTQATSRLFEHIFIDSAAHYSLWDAAQASNKPITVFHHLQADRLEAALQAELLPGERPLVLSDGLFPISGEIAPLPAYLGLARAHAGMVYLDDAHAVGVLGSNGRGTLDYYGLNPDDTCRTTATLAKALGGYGGILWGNSDWIDSIDQNSGASAGASPPLLVAAAASAAALSIARQDPSLRQRLWANVAQARAGLRALGWELEDTPSPVICLPGREGVSLERIKAGLFEQGIAVTLVRGYPSTPPGGALRIAIFATHTAEQIERLVEGIKGLLK